MTTEIINKTEILESLSESISEMQQLISPLDTNGINTIPYDDSWTAAQLFSHVSKSINGMAKAMSATGKPTDRDAGERIPELKKIFLDFSKKMKSPDFIVPDKGPFEKQAVTEDLNNSSERFKESAEHAILTEAVEGLPLGPITKLEILHFVVYHTQRHLHQLRKICEAIKN
ncbi:MAG: DinB family protein [Bacteroidota bacterium]